MANVFSTPGDAGLQRADGAVRVGVGFGDTGTVLRELYQRSPCRVLFPRIDGRERAEVVFLNTAGGVAGGDRLRYALTAGAGAEITATTQAAEKIYRAIDRCARIETAMSAGDGAGLAWLPQETIVFDGARLRRLTEIDARGDARVLALEWLVLGRAAHGETLSRGEIYDNWRVRRDGKLVWADSFRLTGDVGGLTARRALLADARAVATLVYLAPDAPALLDGLRERLAGYPCRIAVGVVAGLLVCRMLAGDAADLRKAVVRLLQDIWSGLGDALRPLPRVWAC